MRRNRSVCSRAAGFIEAKAYQRRGDGANGERRFATKGWSRWPRSASLHPLNGVDVESNRRGIESRGAGRMTRLESVDQRDVVDPEVEERDEPIRCELDGYEAIGIELGRVRGLT